MNKNLELLPPCNLENQLLVRKQHLESLLATKLKSIATAPEGRIRISKSNGVIQYYLITKENPKPVYIPRKNEKIARVLAQKEYDKSLVRNLSLQLKEISRLLKVLSKNSLVTETAFSEMRQKLIEPVTLKNEEYARRWQQVKYEGKTFAEGAPAMFTSRGERVRSKSEVIIADTLARFKIPYRYEWPLELAGLKVYPDFYCINLQSRKEIAWEHFGMMDDPEYLEKMVLKLESYEKAGFYLGKNLIITMETANHPISIKSIENKIKQYLQ